MAARLEDTMSTSTSIPLYLVFSLALAVVFSWVMEHTAGSLLLAHLFHQAINGWAEALPFYPRSTGSLAPFLLVVAVLAAGALLIAWRWSRADPLLVERTAELRGRRSSCRGVPAQGTAAPKRIRRTPSDPKSITTDVPIWFGIATPSPPCSCWCWGSCACCGADDRMFVDGAAYWIAQAPYTFQAAPPVDEPPPPGRSPQ